MIDVYEPLERYRNEFSAKHAENTAALFDSLVRTSQIDIKANRQTVAVIRKLQAQIQSLSSSRSRWTSFNVFCIIIAILAGALLLLSLILVLRGNTFLLSPLNATITGLILIASTLASALLCAPKLATLKTQINQLQQQLNDTIRLAWEQMAPLNKLYDWSHPTTLIQQTVPRIQFDPYFSVGRLNDLYRSFGWDDSYSQNRSVLFSHSGEINGNPFVFAETLSCKQGTKTYHGSKTITWTESYRDANGKRQTRFRSQTLHASVEKPFPLYEAEKILFYGNDAAPTLRFSRAPSPLSNKENSFFGRIHKKHTIRKLEKFSRNLEDDSHYTIMGNRDFEALFHATNRSDEVQFRLLFTPLAQSQMLLLLRDQSIGFGDDFSFVKHNRINAIQPFHLQSTNINTDPSQFHSYDLDSARASFLQFNQDFFRSLYFSFAPLLAIPLYQQTRSHESIYQNPSDSASSFWEHEALANYIGSDSFKHPNCITQSILKTSANPAPDGSQTILVTAFGHRGESRTDYVNVYGDDGRFHKVPVNWTEYLPVQHSSPLSIADTSIPSLQDYQNLLSSNTLQCPWDPKSIKSIFRRGCLAKR